MELVAAEIPPKPSKIKKRSKMWDLLERFKESGMSSAEVLWADSYANSISAYGVTRLVAQQLGGIQVVMRGERIFVRKV